MLSNFNSNAEEKTSVFNNNAETLTNNFNSNASEKLNSYNTNATEKQEKLEDLVETAQDFVSAVTFTSFEVDIDDGSIYVYNAESLGNMGFDINDIDGNLEVDIDTHAIDTRSVIANTLREEY